MIPFYTDVFLKKSFAFIGYISGSQLTVILLPW